ncbi:MAG: glycosyltransferase [Candidatus Kapabacteria bacterium]|jgi:sterol 3beta-glucosyltransferase|nr:glycosyltransferase [Candidatus Kapabacteria bacterium]
MNISFVTIGTRGDVQPFLALALHLQQRGHSPTICSNINMKTMVEQGGIRFVPIHVDTQVLYASEEGKNFLRTGNFAELLKAGNAWFRKELHELTNGIINGCKGADLIISGFLVDEIAIAIAERDKIPFIASNFAPFVPSSSVPGILVTRKNLGFSFLNTATQAIQELVNWNGKKDDINGVRRSLGLPEVRSSLFKRIQTQSIPFLGAWSPQLFPQPGDWGSEKLVTGAWRLPESVRTSIGDHEAPPKLVQWLDAGDAPFFFSFGSMPLLDPENVVQACLEITRKHKVRIIFGAGWNDIRAFRHTYSDAIYFLSEAVNHEWLFERCAGVLHHGGSGSTATSATAGCPTWVFSLFLDQPFWGSRVQNLGIGGHTPYTKFSAETLEKAVLHLQKPHVIKQAKELGKSISREKGTENATRFIEEWYRKRPIPTS